MAQKDGRPPERSGGHRKPRTPPDPEWLYRQQVQATLEYLDDARVEAEASALRTNRGIKKRADGTPSAKPPQAVVPVKYWATVYDEPVVQYDSLRQRLERYRDRLRYLHSRGLYDGPTELVVVNPPEEDDH